MEHDNEPSDAHSLEDLLHRRYSCRAFLETPVPLETIRRILTIAQRTPTWCNTQSWRVWLTGPVATRELASALQERARSGRWAGYDLEEPLYEGVSLDRRREAGYGLYSALGIDREDREARRLQALENYRFFNAPNYMVVTAERALGSYGILDCGAYVGNVLLAAEAVGVASIAQGAVARHSDYLRSHFGIGAERVIVCGVALGFADEEHPANQFRTTRATIDEAVTWCGI